MSSSSALPITREDLRKQIKRVLPLMTKVERAVRLPAQASTVEQGGSYATRVLTQTKQAVQMVETFKRVSDDTENALTPAIAEVAETIRIAAALGIHLAYAFEESSGLKHLIELNSKNRLPKTQEEEFNAKLRTSSFILMFQFASYISWRLGNYRASEMEQARVNFTGIPETSFTHPVDALMCTMFYLGRYLDTAKTEIELAKVTLEYARGLIADLRRVQESLRYTDFFTNVAYKLEDSEFMVNGFEEVDSVVRVVSHFNKVRLDQMVGNPEAKLWARRTGMRLGLYDPTLQKNPIAELGGYPMIRMGMGIPGTGKSMMISVIATVISEIAERRKIPFIFHPFPDDIIQEFQGGTAKKAKQWWAPLHMPGHLIYAPIDDAENHFRNRTHQGTSEGVQQNIGVFLRETEGAGAEFFNNALIDFMTNIPEFMDPAVLSRVQARFSINGAVSVHDWIDQDYLWRRKREVIAPDFFQTEPYDGYTYLDKQKAITSLSQVEKGVYVPKHYKVQRILEQVLRTWKYGQAGFLGHLLDATQDEFPGFSSRDLRNVHTAIDDRLNDYEIPEQWFDDSTLFFEKQYDERVQMLKDLMVGALQGLSFAEVRVSESLRYIDNYAQIADKDFERKVQEEVSRQKVYTEAQRRLTPGRKE